MRERELAVRLRGRPLEPDEQPVVERDLHRHGPDPALPDDDAGAPARGSRLRSRERGPSSRRTFGCESLRSARRSRRSNARCTRRDDASACACRAAPARTCRYSADACRSVPCSAASACERVRCASEPATAQAPTANGRTRRTSAVPTVRRLPSLLLNSDSPPWTLALVIGGAPERLENAGPPGRNPTDRRLSSCPCSWTRRWLKPLQTRSVRSRRTKDRCPRQCTALGSSRAGRRALAGRARGARLPGGGRLPEPARARRRGREGRRGAAFRRDHAPARRRTCCARAGSRCSPPTTSM